MGKRILAIILAGIMLIGGMPASQPVKTMAATTSTSAALPQQVVTTLEILKADSKGNLNLTKRVTRAQFSEMLVNASIYKDKVGSTTNTSLYKDVKKTYWAAPYIKIAVTQGWMSGNLKGQFRPTSYVTLQEAVNAVVALLGYTDDDFQGNKAAAKMAFYEAQDLNEKIKKTKNQTLTRQDCMNLFYNTLITETKGKEIYAATLGHVLDANGDVDYLSLVNDKMKGPVIANSKWKNSIPFTTTYAAFYRNGSKSKATDIKDYDVLYYSKSLMTIWAYSNKVTGRYEKAEPNRLSPTEVTIAGQSYRVGSQDVAYELSTLGKYDIGDNISVLLGKDDSIVGIVEAAATNTTVGGVILEKGTRMNSSDKDAATLTTYIRIVDATGAEHEYDCDTESLRVGDAVFISYIESKAVVNKLELYSMYGQVDSKAENLGAYKFAKDVNILDLKTDIYISVSKARLSNTALYSGDVIYYNLNSSNEITDLILKDVTGDIYDYGILISATETGSVGTFMGTYTYDIGGVQRVATTSLYIIGNRTPGPSKFEFDNGQLRDIKTLSRLEVSSVSGLTISDGKATYTLSDKAAVYLIDEDGKYYITTLSKVSNLKNYDLKAYYDKREEIGGRVRVITATIKK